MESQTHMRRSAGCFACAATAMLVVSTGAAYGGSGRALPIVWSSDVEASVRYAKATDRPIMILVGSNTLTYEQLYQHGRRGPAINPFEDPRVIDAARNFVALRVPRGHGTAYDLLEGRVPARVNRVLVLLTPEGDTLGQYGMTGSPEDLAAELRLAFRAYSRKLFESKLKPVLEDNRASERTLGVALRKIRDFEIVEGDEAVIALAERPRLGPAVRRLAYDALASLSTSAAVDYLIDRAVQGDGVDANDARRSLERVKPSGAAHLLKVLDADEADRRLGAYRALVRVLQIPNGKPNRFWETADTQLQAQELERVKRLAESRLTALGQQVAGPDEALLKSDRSTRADAAEVGKDAGGSAGSTR